MKANDPIAAQGFRRSPIRLDKKCHRLLFLAGWNEREAAFPLPPAMLRSADQFATQAAEGSGMQSDKLSPKDDHKLPFTLIPFLAASLSPVVNCHADLVRTSGTRSCLTHL